MTKPIRLQLSRKAGFVLQFESRATNGLPAVNVARPTKWGNPHLALRCWFHGPMPEIGLPEFDAVTAADADREGKRIAAGLFRLEAERRPEAFAELRGKNLACWCKPPSATDPGDPCHGDVLLELANMPAGQEVAPEEGRDCGPADVRRPVRSEAEGGSVRTEE